MKVFVWTDLYGAPLLVGRLAAGTAQNVWFQYAPSYLAQPQVHALSPDLPLQEAAHSVRVFKKQLQGVLGDAMPDAWGQRVLAALHSNPLEPLETLLKMDCHSVGSLRFSGVARVCSPRQPAPDVAELADALASIEALDQGYGLDPAFQAIIAAGSSLGGMRPKVAVRWQGKEYLAKLARHNEPADLPAIEVATLHWAAACGLQVCSAHHTVIAGRSVALIERFDRQPQQHYLSAHGLWNRLHYDNQAETTWASYGGLADAARKLLPAEAVPAALKELFCRAAFNLWVGNTDDHGKNHGFLMNAQGQWALAPAFDVLPTFDGNRQFHALGLGPEGRKRSLDNLLKGAGRFGLHPDEAIALWQALQKKAQALSYPQNLRAEDQRRIQQQLWQA